MTGGVVKDGSVLWDAVPSLVRSAISPVEGAVDPVSEAIFGRVRSQGYAEV